MAATISSEELRLIDEKIAQAREKTRRFTIASVNEQEKNKLLLQLSKRRALRNGVIAVAADLVAAPIANHFLGVDFITAMQVGIVGSVAVDLYFARKTAKRISQLS